MRKLLPVLMLPVLFTAQSASAAVQPELPASIKTAAASVEHAQALAGDLAASLPLAQRLARIAQLDSANVADVQLAGLDFVASMELLYTVAGMPPKKVLPPSAEVGMALAPVIEATARGALLANQALSKLSAAQIKWLRNHVPTPAAAGSDLANKFARLASQIDRNALHTAASAIAAAIASIPDGLELSASFVDPSGLIEIGSTNSDTYTVNRLLVVDLGGNDYYYNSAGAIGPGVGNAAGLPISINVDLGGDDSYWQGNPNSPENTLITQGVGIGGIGMLIDRWGNDSYSAYLTATPASTCFGDPVFGGYAGRHSNTVYAQGTAAAGIGVLADLSGTDNMFAGAFSSTPSNCHFVRMIAAAQGAGMIGGTGVLFDDASNDYRSVYTNSFGFPGYPGAQDWIADSYGQGFAAGGVGVLADAEGNDYNSLGADSRWSNEGYDKGVFSTAFGQGSVSGMLIHPKSGVSAGVAPADPGLAIPCFTRAKAGDGGSGGQGEAAATPCQPAGVAVHLDVTGSDTYRVTTNALHGKSVCAVGANALTGAQGAAAWGGLGLFAELDVAATDSMTATSYSYGGPCESRATTIAQGAGGSVRYPIWDDPAAYYAGIDRIDFYNNPVYASAAIAAPAIGIAAMGAPPCVPDPRTAAVTPGIACLTPTSSLTTGTDSFNADARADNPDNYWATSEVRAQGASASPRPVYVSANPPGVARALPWSGVGIHADAGGNDSRIATARSVSNNAFSSPSTVAAQGGADDGVGILVDLLGADSNQASATSTVGVRTRIAQGQARATGAAAMQPIAGLVDLGGKDTYGPTVTCQANGDLTSAVLWGNLNNTCTTPGTLIIGLDALSGVSL